MKNLILFLNSKSAVILLLALLASPAINAQDSVLFKPYSQWSAGFRFNNPSGITVKKSYGNKAFEITLGRSNPWNYNAHRIFKRHKELKNYTYAGYEPVFHPWNLQVHYLIQRPSELFRGIQTYYGFGPQLNSYAFDYDYYYQNGGNTVYKHKTIYRTTLGADALAGIEYTFNKVPISIFADITAYMEVIGYPLYNRIRTGWGFRVNL